MLGSLSVTNRRYEVAYVVCGTHIRVPRARGAYEADFFSTEHISVTQSVKVPKKRPKNCALCSKKTHFCLLRARGAREAGYFSTDKFLLPRRFQRGIARPQIPTHIQTPLGRTDGQRR